MVRIWPEKSIFLRGAVGLKLVVRIWPEKSIFWRGAVGLKLVSSTFCQIFIFHQMIALQNYEKCFLFHLKSPVRSRDIQIFILLSSPLFLPVSHCFRGWFEINLKVYDINNCLNMDFITHFVWYLRKEKRYNIETLSIDRVFNTKHFYEKIMQEMFTKPLFHFGK